VTRRRFMGMLKDASIIGAGLAIGLPVARKAMAALPRFENMSIDNDVKWDYSKQEEKVTVRERLKIELERIVEREKNRPLTHIMKFPELITSEQLSVDPKIEEKLRAMTGRVGLHVLGRFDQQRSTKILVHGIPIPSFVQWFYESTGAGTPLDYRYFVEALSKKYNVAIFSYNATRTLDTIVQSLKDEIKALDPRDFDLVGYSYGTFAVLHAINSDKSGFYSRSLVVTLSYAAGVRFFKGLAQLGRRLGPRGDRFIVGDPESEFNLELNSEEAVNRRMTRHYAINVEGEEVGPKGPGIQQENLDRVMKENGFILPRRSVVAHVEPIFRQAVLDMLLLIFKAKDTGRLLPQHNGPFNQAPGFRADSINKEERRAGINTLSQINLVLLASPVLFGFAGEFNLLVFGSIVLGIGLMAVVRHVLSRGRKGVRPLSLQPTIDLLKRIIDSVPASLQSRMPSNIDVKYSRFDTGSRRDADTGTIFIDDKFLAADDNIKAVILGHELAHILYNDNYKDVSIIREIMHHSYMFRGFSTLLAVPSIVTKLIGQVVQNWKTELRADKTGITLVQLAGYDVSRLRGLYQIFGFFGNLTHPPLVVRKRVIEREVDSVSYLHTISTFVSKETVLTSSIIQTSGEISVAPAATVHISRRNFLITTIGAVIAAFFGGYKSAKTAIIPNVDVIYDHRTIDQIKKAIDAVPAYTVFKVHQDERNEAVAAFIEERSVAPQPYEVALMIKEYGVENERIRLIVKGAERDVFFEKTLKFPGRVKFLIHTHPDGKPLPSPNVDLKNGTYPFMMTMANKILLRYETNQEVSHENAYTALTERGFTHLFDKSGDSNEAKDIDYSKLEEKLLEMIRKWIGFVILSDPYGNKITYERSLRLAHTLNQFYPQLKNWYRILPRSNVLQGLSILAFSPFIVGFTSSNIGSAIGAFFTSFLGLALVFSVTAYLAYKILTREEDRLTQKHVISPSAKELISGILISIPFIALGRFMWAITFGHEFAPVFEGNGLIRTFISNHLLDFLAPISLVAAFYAFLAGTALTQSIQDRMRVITKAPWKLYALLALTHSYLFEVFEPANMPYPGERGATADSLDVISIILGYAAAKLIYDLISWIFRKVDQSKINAVKKLTSEEKLLDHIRSIFTSGWTYKVAQTIPVVRILRRKLIRKQINELDVIWRNVKGAVDSDELYRALARVMHYERNADVLLEMAKTIAGLPYAYDAVLVATLDMIPHNRQGGPHDMPSTSKVIHYKTHFVDQRMLMVLVPALVRSYFDLSDEVVSEILIPRSNTLKNDDIQRGVLILWAIAQALDPALYPDTRKWNKKDVQKYLTENEGVINEISRSRLIEELKVVQSFLALHAA